MLHFATNLFFHIYNVLIIPCLVITFAFAHVYEVSYKHFTYGSHVCVCFFFTCMSTSILCVIYVFSFIAITLNILHTFSILHANALEVLGDSPEYFTVGNCICTFTSISTYIFLVW